MAAAVAAPAVSLSYHGHRDPSISDPGLSEVDGKHDMAAHVVDHVDASRGEVIHIPCWVKQDGIAGVGDVVDRDGLVSATTIGIQTVHRHGVDKAIIEVERGGKGGAEIV
jgi:hypothetical protein